MLTSLESNIISLKTYGNYYTEKVNLSSKGKELKLAGDPKTGRLSLIDSLVGQEFTTTTKVEAKISIDVKICPNLFYSSIKTN
mgnify:CR=1